MYYWNLHLLSKFADIKDFIILKLARELIAQGHRHTGALIESMEGRVHGIKGGIEIVIKANKYAIYLDKGVRASRIPYRRGSGKKKSDYIKGLIAYFEKKGVADPKGAAFATARKQKEEGMPTRNSYKYSRNGKRKNFIGDTMEKHGKHIEDQLLEAGFDDINKKMNFMWNKFER